MKITEVEIIPIKPTDGLVGFASFVLNDMFYLGSIAILTRMNGGYRLVYPTKKAGTKNINVFYPINKQVAENIENEIIKKFEKVMNNDRHNSTDNSIN